MTPHPPAMHTCHRCNARFSLAGDRVEGTAPRARIRCPRCQGVSPLAEPVEDAATPDEEARRPPISVSPRSLGALAGMFAAGALVGVLGVFWLAHRAAPGDPPPMSRRIPSGATGAGPSVDDATMGTAQAHKSLARLLRRQGHFTAAQQAARRYRKERLPAAR